MIENYSTEELQTELDRRATATTLTGEYVFEFGSRRKAERWQTAGGVAELAASGDGTLAIDGPRFDEDGSLTIPFEYTAIGASKADVARFAFRVAGNVLTNSGNQRLNPNGLRISIADVERSPGRRQRMRQT